MRTSLQRLRPHRRAARSLRSPGRSGRARPVCSRLGPAFSLLARVLGAYVLDIVVCEVAGLERHCDPVHAGNGAFLRAKSGRCRNAGGSRRHEGATIKRCHNQPP
jgi:hypothetical protein